MSDGMSATTHLHNSVINLQSGDLASSVSGSIPILQLHHQQSAHAALFFT